MKKKAGKVICFDWNFTLCNDLFFGQLDPSSKEHMRLQEAMFKSDDSANMLGDWMRGKMDYKQVLARVSSRAGMRQDLVEEMFVDGCRRMRFALPEMPEMVARLRSKYEVWVATDNMDSFSMFTVPALKLGEIFDGVLNSADLGALKADFSVDGESMFFGKFLSKKGLTPTDLTLVDDSQPKGLDTYGINYVKIEPRIGLLDALDGLLVASKVNVSRHNKH